MIGTKVNALTVLKYFDKDGTYLGSSWPSSCGTVMQSREKMWDIDFPEGIALGCVLDIHIELDSPLTRALK